MKVLRFVKEIVKSNKIDLDKERDRFCEKNQSSAITDREILVSVPSVRQTDSLKDP